VKPLRVGSLCSGYGGLEQALAGVLDIDLAWVADPDPGAAAILAHHHPDVPNLGDITKTNWEDVAPVDLLCGGYPCQPFSSAGRRKGVEDERHIWPYIATALRVLRPRYALFENVANHLRIGFDVVLADLAGLGFDAEWCTVRASEVGAPHRRERLFILATAQDADSAARGERRLAAPGQEASGWAWADAGRRGGAPAADTACAERRGPEPADLGQAAGSTAEPGERAGAPADTNGALGRLNVQRCGPGQVQGTAIAERPTQQPRRLHRGCGDESAVAWGQFEPAIRRWEHVTGHPAPRPTEPGRTGERLSPAFVEWMQGIPPGWVTAVAGLSRNQQLKALGNGVVPQQAAAALRLLLPAVLDAQREPAA
jgi:DNA (cytosine-5)-methyltransferase 1